MFKTPDMHGRGPFNQTVYFLAPSTQHSSCTTHISNTSTRKLLLHLTSQIMEQPTRKTGKWKLIYNIQPYISIFPNQPIKPCKTEWKPHLTSHVNRAPVFQSAGTRHTLYDQANHESPPRGGQTTYPDKKKRSNRTNLQRRRHARPNKGDPGTDLCESERARQRSGTGGKAALTMVASLGWVAAPRRRLQLLLLLLLPRRRRRDDKSGRAKRLGGYIYWLG